MSLEFIIASIALGYLFAGSVKVHQDFTEDTFNPVIYTLKPTPLRTFCIMLFWVTLETRPRMKFILWALSSLMVAGVLWLLSFLIDDIHVRALVVLVLLVPGVLAVILRK
jgi:hypothetical protein